MMWWSGSMLPIPQRARSANYSWFCRFGFGVWVFKGWSAKHWIGHKLKPKSLNQVGYLDDRTVPPDSITPTFAVAALYINNQRWSGVPFILSCGKAMDEKLVDIRVQFKPTSGNLFDPTKVLPNELVMRVQPDEAIYLRCMTKSPGKPNPPNHQDQNLFEKILEKCRAAV
jgi:glucose-6-phosphate 1-dehydrogenase